VNPLSALSHAAVPATASQNSPAKIKSAAEQFEALMISEMLKTAREAGSGSGWMGTGDEDETGQTSLDMAEQQVASVMAKAGGFGMQSFIAQSLIKHPVS
jgi:Rod binding domain-containing protein